MPHIADHTLHGVVWCGEGQTPEQAHAEVGITVGDLAMILSWKGTSARRQKSQTIEIGHNVSVRMDDTYQWGE